MFSTPSHVEELNYIYLGVFVCFLVTNHRRISNKFNSNQQVIAMFFEKKWIINDLLCGIETWYISMFVRRFDR